MLNQRQLPLVLDSARPIPRFPEEALERIQNAIADLMTQVVEQDVPVEADVVEEVEDEGAR
jgi:hypothetical protein